MKEYIERAAAMESIIGLTIVDTAVAQYANAVCYHLRNLPTADVVPVVRCRECIHWHNWGACGHPDNGFDAPPMGPGDFCSKGKRSTD